MTDVEQPASVAAALEEGIEHGIEEAVEEVERELHQDPHGVGAAVEAAREIPIQSDADREPLRGTPVSEAPAANADVPTQQVVPSESAGTQTAAGSPSEQGGALEAPTNSLTPHTLADEPGGDGGEPQPAQPPVELPKNPIAEREVPDVPQGTFCTVFAGPYAGRYGVFQDVASRFSDGTPENVIVQTRDADDLRIVVAYADIRPDAPGKR